VNAHERYEELAVGHVLGGLGASEAADFRSHLLGCRDCRLRVAELRDIAADLAAAEREERSEARVRTEVARRTAETGDGDDGITRPHLPSGLVAIVIVAAVVLFGALAFWNLHLRTQVAAFDLLVERQDDALSELAVGVSVVVDAVAPAGGLVVVDDAEVAFSFVDLPPLADTERYVVWLLDTEDGGDEPVLVARTEGRNVAGVTERRGAREILVSVEDGPAGTTATVGREVARADLTAGVAPSR
jgi:hypothetical protein